MPESQSTKPIWKRPVFIAASVIALVVVTIAGGWYWHYAKHHESTDDAFIDAHITPVSPQISGQVVRVSVDDNQAVSAGDPLVEIDPEDYRVNLGQATAAEAAARAEARRARAEAERQRKLFARDRVSRQTLDDANAAAEVAQAQVELTRQKIAAARLDFSRTRIIAPQAGRVTKKSVEPGEYVQPGQALMSIVPSRVWVTANFKETQLRNMHPGQRARISIDVYKGRSFTGHIDSFQSGTGSRFSLLPPENATGNYIKVVQRVPVKIVFDEPVDRLFLAPGMSVEPVVEIP